MSEPGKVLITGGEGFIGSHLANHLRTCGFDVNPTETDVLDSKLFQTEFKKEKWDAVIHLAALSAYDICEEDLAHTLQVNLAGTAHVIEMIKRHTPSAHLVFASTGQIYRAEMMSGDLVFTEDSPIGPRNIYGYSKWYSELLLKDAVEKNGLRVSALRLFNHTHKSQSPDFFLPYIYRTLSESRGKIVKVPVGNIDVKRDLGSVYDLVRAFERVITWGIEKPSFFECFNVSCGIARSLRDVAAGLATKIGKDIEFIIDQDRVRKNEIQSVCGKSTKLQKTTGWKVEATNDARFLDLFLTDMA